MEEQKQKKQFEPSVFATDKLKKLAFLSQLLSVGFIFGGIVYDQSIKGPIDFNVIYLDEDKDGYEIKARRNTFCLYEICKGRSRKGVWYRYEDVIFEDGFFQIEEKEIINE